MTLVSLATHHAGMNFVHLVVACVVGWGFVAGHVTTWGIVKVRGKGRS